MDDQTPIQDLKGSLIDTLIHLVKDGVTVLDKDGNPVVISAPAPYLAVAAKVVKDFASEAEAGGKAKNLSETVERYRLRKAAEARVN